MSEIPTHLEDFIRKFRHTWKNYVGKVCRYSILGLRYQFMVCRKSMLEMQFYVGNIDILSYFYVGNSDILIYFGVLGGEATPN